MLLLRTFELFQMANKYSCARLAKLWNTSSRDMEGSGTVEQAVKNGNSIGEINGNSSKKEANGFPPRKISPKSTARRTTSHVILSVLKNLFYILQCLFAYGVFLFVLVIPLVPLVVVYYSLKLLERYLVYWATGDLPLTGLDAIWQQSTDENRLAINSLVCTENKSGDIDQAVEDFRKVISERMVNAKKPNGELLYPRAGCCIRRGFFQYFFQEDKSFRIENHVFKWEGEVPSSKEELASIVSKLSNETFPEGVSPWYFCMVPTNFGDKDIGIVFRVSHSVADGVSLTRFLINKLPDQSTPEKEAVKFTSVSKVPLLAKALLTTPEKLLKRLLVFADQSILHGPKISGIKKVTWHEAFELKLIKQIKAATGTTVNDVLMSCLSLAIRRYFQRKGVDNPPDFTASIPVDVRLTGSSKELAFQNKFSLVFLKLAVATEGVLEQLWETKARMDECKYSGEPLATAAVMMLSNEVIPEFVVSKMNSLITMKTSCVLSNVPGPQHSFSVSGSRVKYMTFWPPQKDNLAVGLSIYTYAGQVIVGVQGDVSVLPDPEIITEEFGNAVDEMAESVLHTTTHVGNGHAIH